ncbi:hypothetical protein DQ04_04251050 [Trypanosoma grayi]|uniref:hypothetical protein n=1 Tax=Trypanosoma grayi TaxID=71804 RepID=UPI0004F40D5D|nr:hypothetical protein DQ04_04251050 [Trypanosoma grayi]KEG10050.1 hypothetical protein DQ04_04251050 [Trypanosoma grayi]
MRGKEGGADAADDESYLQAVTRLCTNSRFLLAIKAYERALYDAEGATAAESLSEEVGDVVPVDVLFKDFLLHCNALSVKCVGTDLRAAKDYLHICLYQLERRGLVQWSREADKVSEVLVPDQDDEGITFLISVTLNNWSCLLLRSGEIEEAAVFLQAALYASPAIEMTRIVLLNMCALHVRNCCFPEIRLTAMGLFQEGEGDIGGGERKLCTSLDATEDVNGLLFAFAYHNVAIAEEYLAPQDAEKFYNQAKECIIASPYQEWSSIIEGSRRRFQAIVQRHREEAARKREAIEEEMEAARLAEVSNRRKGRAAKNATVQRSSVKPQSRSRKSKKRISTLAADGSDEPVEFPPISEEVWRAIRARGLTGAVVPLLSIAEVGHIVFGKGQDLESPFALLQGVSSSSVAMILLWEETPLQVADERERENSTPVRRTVWSVFAPRYEDRIILPPIKPKRGIMESTMTVDALKSFMPPPLSEKAIEDAERGVTGVKKLLNHRLMALLRAENAFEEKWKATMVVKKTLTAFNLAQDIMKLKVTIKENRAKRTALENASARRIVRFFRLVSRSHHQIQGPIDKNMRIKHFEEKSSVTLQKYVRRWLAVKELRRLQAERQANIKRVVTVQSIYRGRVTRRQYFAWREDELGTRAENGTKEKREFAATQIQRAYRRHAYLLQKWCDEGQTKRFILHHYKCSREYYATLIQKTFRGYLVRRVYGRTVYAKRCYGRNCCRAAVFNTCATIIQSAFRGHVARRAQRGQLQQHLLQTMRKCVEARQQRQQKAAVVIQCAYRRYRARQTIAQIRAAREKERLLRRKRVYPSFRLEEQVY